MTRSSPCWGISPRTVSRVRRQLVTEGFDTALCRRRQPPRPDKIKIKGDIEQRLIELACSEPPKGAATGPCNCWPTSWSSWAWSIGSASRRSGWRKKRHQAVDRRDLVHPAERRLRVRRRMEDVIQTYQLPYDPAYPVVCFDEACKQLFGEVREPRRPRRGHPAQVDYEYERKGVCHQLLMCEPLRGWRHVHVSARCTRKDYARCVRELVDVALPRGGRIRLVQDNLNTHDEEPSLLPEAFPPAEARWLLLEEKVPSSTTNAPARQLGEDCPDDRASHDGSAWIGGRQPGGSRPKSPPGRTNGTLSRYGSTGPSPSRRHGRSCGKLYPSNEDG